MKFARFSQLGNSSARFCLLTNRRWKDSFVRFSKKSFAKWPVRLLRFFRADNEMWPKTDYRNGDNAMAQLRKRFWSAGNCGWGFVDFEFCGDVTEDGSDGFCRVSDQGFFTFRWCHFYYTYVVWLRQVILDW